MDETENRIVFKDIDGVYHDIRIERSLQFEKLVLSYCIWFVKADGKESYCYLDANDDTNYVVYRGTKYTGRDFNRLVLAVQNENNRAAIEELE